MKTYLEISLLIPTLNRPESLKDTLNSVFNANFIPLQIVIVDQSDDDKTRGLVLDYKMKFPNLSIEYIYNQDKSLVKARNVAFSKARYEKIVCCDDDINVFCDTFLKVDQYLSSNVGLVGAYSQNHSKKNNLFGYIAGYKKLFHSNEGYYTKAGFGRLPQKKVSISKTTWAMGYFFAIRKSICTNSGIYWDEKLSAYSYGEDLEFSIRYCKAAKLNGMDCIYPNDLNIIHKVSQEYRTPSLSYYCMYFANRIYIIKKNSLSRTLIPYYWSNFCFTIYSLFSKKHSFKLIVNAKNLVYKRTRDIKKGIL